MKNKWLVAIAFLLLAGFTAQAQGVSFGLRGGFDLQNINGKDFDGDALELSLVPRFNAGVVVEIPVAPDFFVQPGVLFSTKGAKAKDELFGQDLSLEYNLGYIEVPISFLYKPQLGNGRFLLGFGPYVGYGITGKVEYTINNTTTTEDIEYTKEYDGLVRFNQFKPLDFGANVFFGYELAGGLSFQINTQLGLAEINAENTSVNSEASFKNTGFGISLGYRF
ncbi:MAG: PorT family protein [Bacteroidales bacterium]|nr:PorT family protein [Bacteroidales bacterium]